MVQVHKKHWNLMFAYAAKNASDIQIFAFVFGSYFLSSLEGATFL
jgi:hypothetical protein